MKKGSKMTDEQRKRMSEAHKGINTGMSGKKHSPESILKMRESHKRTLVNPELRKKISEATKRAMANPEVRRKLSEAGKGHIPWNKGIPHSEKHKQKLREARRKLLLNPEFLRKLSESHKGQRAWNKGISPSKGTIEKQKATYKQTLSLHPEIRIKMSLAKKGKPSWNKGIPMREETRKKLREVRKGKQYSPKTEFKKGHIPWHKGKKGIYSQEQLKRMSEARKGTPAWNKGISPTKEQIEKQRTSMKKITSNPQIRKVMSEKFKKAWSDPELRNKQSERIKKYFSNPEARKRLSEALKGHTTWNLGKKGLQVAWNKGVTGEKSTSWKGGLSFEPYSPDWTKELKNLIRERDSYACQICFKKGYPIHHIDYNKKNCNPENLVTLCKNCHTKTNWNRAKWTKFFRDNTNL